MIPKEKANELIENSYQIIIDLVDVNNAFYYSKQCALIAVDEILQKGMLENAPFMRNGKDLLSNSNAIRYKDFWQKVKQEIINL